MNKVLGMDSTQQFCNLALGFFIELEFRHGGFLWREENWI